MIHDLKQSWSLSMATKDPRKHQDAENGRGPGYETRDANIAGLLQFAFWMAVILAVTLVGIKFSFNYFKKVEPMGEMASPMLKATDRMLPPSPRLQSQPHQELVDYCAAQQREVTTYGWVDQPSGVARIPIDRAMDLVLDRGLPARSAAEVPTGAAMAPTALASVPEGADVQGQCDYVTEKQNVFEGGESGESKH
jgi:hypothetical protein